jgi:hypothetical protein
MLDFLKKRRRRRRPQDPMKKLGNTAGKAVAALLVKAITSFLRKK